MEKEWEGSWMESHEAPSAAVIFIAEKKFFGSQEGKEGLI